MVNIGNLNNSIELSQYLVWVNIAKLKTMD
jgi:hypothetical protein